MRELNRYTVRYKTIEGGVETTKSDIYNAYDYVIDEYGHLWITGTNENNERRIVTFASGQWVKIETVREQ